MPRLIALTGIGGIGYYKLFVVASSLTIVYLFNIYIRYI